MNLLSIKLNQELYDEMEKVAASKGYSILKSSETMAPDSYGLRVVYYTTEFVLNDKKIVLKGNNNWFHTSGRLLVTSYKYKNETNEWVKENDLLSNYPVSLVRRSRLDNATLLENLLKLF